MLKFNKGAKYWYCNKHSIWEQIKFLDTMTNVVSKRVYYKFLTNRSKELILTEKQIAAYMNNP